MIDPLENRIDNNGGVGGGERKGFSLLARLVLIQMLALLCFKCLGYYKCFMSLIANMIAKIVFSSQVTKNILYEKGGGM